MKCAWEALLHILPSWLRQDVDTWGRDTLQEIRLRRGQPPELIRKEDRFWLERNIQSADLDFCVNTASRYSPWASATSSMGYLTAPGGHRIGLCGEVVLQDGKPAGMRSIQSLCIRVARDVAALGDCTEALKGSVLILGAPGWGKTTLLRDLIRLRSRHETVSVVDEREEIFPEGFDCGRQTDILRGCPKARGILQLLKTMGPQTIAVDEITEEEDCRALIQAYGCGVNLLATAHAGSLQDYRNRRAYQTVFPVFHTVLALQADQTYQVERMVP